MTPWILFCTPSPIQTDESALSKKNWQRNISAINKGCNYYGGGKSLYSLASLSWPSWKSICIFSACAQFSIIFFYFSREFYHCLACCLSFLVWSSLVVSGRVCISSHTICFHIHCRRLQCLWIKVNAFAYM